MSYQPKPKKKLFGARFTSTLSVTLVLLLLGMGALAAFTVRSLTKTIREQYAVTLTLNDSADSLQVETLVGDLKRAPFQSAVTYISADSALQIAAREVGEDPMDLLGFNPLQASIEVHLNADYANTDSVKKVVATLRDMAGDLLDPQWDIDFDEKALGDNSQMIGRIAWILLVMAGVLLLISISLVDITVHLALHSDRFLIGTMRLVGATNWFIRKPFVMGQAMRGLLAAVLAIAILAGGLYFGALHDQFFQQLVESVLTLRRIIIIAGGMMIAGSVICAFSAWRATGRYLHCTTDELYLM